ncbi:MAG TPA: enoyl-CoA hydratase/isomerase family protein [Trueperaceae bacterium]|nr:enoyl-CoA hydratase/isomerase family protein [Trueperaceae bacterium]
MGFDDYQRLELSRPEEGILVITMNRPERLNAADEAMHRELVEIWRDVDAADDVDVAVLRGAGKGFSAGGDLDMVEHIADDWETRVRVWKEARDLVRNLVDCGKPVVSAIHGPAVGAGLVAGLLADVSIAARDARIIDGHTRLGVAAGDHAAAVWPLLIGMAKAKYYLLTCEPMSGAEAERLGLVSLCVDADELDARALEVARRLRSGSRTALRWTKYALNNWYRLAGPTFDASLALEFLGFTGPDVREGLAAHRQKRAPSFDDRSEL